MNNNTPSQSEILNQIIQLYELSLAVGTSSDLEQNCRHFCDRILARRNLSYAGLWLHHLIDNPLSPCELSYSDPQSEYNGPVVLAVESFLLKLIQQKKKLSITRDELLNEYPAEHDYLPNGDSFTFINLENLGFLVLAGYGERAIWQEWQLSQMLPIFKSFATSVRSNIIFSQLEVEIIERKKAEKIALQASEVKSQFLANISHELRTPLNAVLGMSQLLEDTQLDSEQTELVETIINSGQTLLGLINDTLDLSKLEAHKFTLEKTDFELKKVLDDIAQIFAKQCKNKNLKFICDFDKHLDKSFVGDPFRIKQILMNLIGNALKFTEQGEVSITVKPVTSDEENFDIEFCVSDTGIGIDPGHIEHLFDSFHQVDASVTRKFGGTGLGLAICKQVVDLMQGTLTVESEPNLGSQFRFIIPLKTSSQQLAQDQIPINTTSHSNHNPSTRILLVEDDHFNQLVAKKLLNKLGYQIDIVENGLKAIQSLQKNNYDLVFMDMQMPEMGGIETTRLIRNKDSSVINPNITIIAMTANAMESDRHLCLQAGMNDYLSKPIEKNLLAEKLETWLG